MRARMFRRRDLRLGPIFVPGQHRCQSARYAGVKSMLDLSRPIAYADYAATDHAGVDAAQAQGAAGWRVHELHRVHTEALDELSAPGVRLGGDLQDRRPDLEPRAGRNVVATQVQIEKQLVPRERPSRRVLRDQRNRTRTHDVDLRLRVGHSVRPVAVVPRLPRVADQADDDVELALVDDFA